LLLDDGRAFDLVPQVVRIGRSREADLRLDDTAVSRVHAEIRRDGDGQHLLVDLGSTNGTLLNGGRVSTARLRDGDEVGIGAALLVYRAAATARSAEPRSAAAGAVDATSVWPGGALGPS
jgi:pSer/pThr/pTyr-binding forkhead associated (FHA) protein